MIDLGFIRDHPQQIQKAAKDKSIDIDVEKIIAVDLNYRKVNYDIQNIREDRNLLNEQIKKEGKPTEEQLKSAELLKKNLKEKEDSAKKYEEDLRKLWLEIPNPAKSDVKVGKDESDNEIIENRKYKEPTKFDFKPKDHLELGEFLDVIDVKNAAKVSGTRFAYLKNEGVLLEFALIQLALEVLTKEGFIPIVPPVLINQEITEGLGYWQAGGNEDYYLVGEPQENKNFYLAGTAEHSIVPMYKDEILDKKDLPKRYVGFSSAFRREAGTYGKDTRGILRVHQFDKVEMVSFVTEDQDDKEHEYLLSLEEKLFQLLEIPYQVVKMCTGDLGFPVARKFDLEAWMPGQNKYREITSTSTTTDFQSRRLNIKYYNDNGEKKFVHILNGTAFAIGRTIISILENYQQKDGSVLIPKILQKYLHFEKITPKK
ncbi:MAG: serine--tRNA ligase [Candidatus Levybacteria bacterium]|nr:serine--tRNA ligase [Candidatus Levybacteria bacterium]